MAFTAPSRAVHHDARETQPASAVSARRASGAQRGFVRVPWVRWFLRHGVARWVIQFGVRRGNAIARLMGDPQVQDDPYAVQTQLRDDAALVQGPMASATCRYAAMDTMLRSSDYEAGPRSSASARWLLHSTRDERTAGPLDPPSLLVIDPPEHPRYRRLITQIFSPRSVAAMRPRIEAITDRLLDDMELQHEVDFVEAFARRLPVAVIADLLGAPSHMIDQFLIWSEQASPILDIGLDREGFESAEDALRSVNDWLDDYFAKVRANPGDDFISQLLAHGEGDEPLSDAELRSVIQLLLAAGFVTIVDMLGNGLVTLMQHPDQLAAAQADPTLWGNAVEELLRYESPVQLTARFAKCPTQLGDADLKPGELVLAFLGAANRDPERFANPEVFDIKRQNAREHLAFSRGLHHCAGAGLARLEGAVAFERLFTRFPKLSLAGCPQRRYSTVLRGFSAIPVHPHGAATETIDLRENAANLMS